MLGNIFKTMEKPGKKDGKRERPAKIKAPEPRSAFRET